MSLQSQLHKLAGSDVGGDTGLIIPKGQVTEAGLEYVRRLRDVKYYETIFEILARQFELAQLDEARQGAVIQVVDPAVTPDVRSFPNRELIVGGATAIGFFLALAVALIQAFYTYWKSHSDQDERLSELRRALSMRRDSCGFAQGSFPESILFVSSRLSSQLFLSEYGSFPRPMPHWKGDLRWQCEKRICNGNTN